MLRAVCLLLAISLTAGLELKTQLKDHWQSFKKVHLKSYNPNEEDKRKDIFKKNVETILQHNLKADLGEETYKLGINQFADMTEEEIVQKYMGLSSEPFVIDDAEVDEVTELREDYPEKVDWRDSGFITPPKHQLSCGSCWAFATVAVVEAHYGLATKKHVRLSQQNLLDCALNGGCEKGGNVLAGFYWIIGRGINTEECYEYHAQKSDTCKFNNTCVGATMKSHKSIRKGNEDDLLRVVATKGPVAATMYANPRQFSLYRGGLYNPEKCSETSNHAVVIVGYGTEDDQPYWLIKNSWGSTWGEEGFFKLPRNAGSKCNIANEARYPII